MTIKDFFSFRQNRFFWANILAMAVVVVGLLFGVLKGLDIYTRHGEAVIVPDVKGMGVEEAEKMFRNRGLVCIVSDSSYVKTLPAGCIMTDRHQLRYHWVKGHAENPYNNRCDEMAVAESRKFKA